MNVFADVKDEYHRNECLLVFLCRFLAAAIEWHAYFTQNLVSCIIHRQKIFQNNINSLNQGLGNLQCSFFERLFFWESLEEDLQPINAVEFDFDTWTVPISAPLYLNECSCGGSCPSTVIGSICCNVHEIDRLECFHLGRGNTWKKYHCEIEVNENTVYTKVVHSGYFVFAVRRQSFVEKQIIPLLGGQLWYMNRKDLRLKFPANSFESQHLNASMEVLYNDVFYTSEDINLAGPVVCLGPSGTVFSKDIQVTIPLRKELCNSNLSLRFEVSQTKAGEKPMWKPLSTNYELNFSTYPWTVTFSVRHFSLYRAVVNIVDNLVPDSLKTLTSSYVPSFTFKTHVNVYMTNCNDKKQFGLCVVGNRTVAPFKGIQEYPSHVGWCTPRKLKGERLIIKLKSKIFEADESIGEDPELRKCIDYTGLDFDVQFSCILQTERSVSDVEMFGKVVLCSIDEQGNDIEEFSLNLIKQRQPSSQMSKEISAGNASIHPKNTEVDYLSYGTSDVQSTGYNCCSKRRKCDNIANVKHVWDTNYFPTNNRCSNFDECRKKTGVSRKRAYAHAHEHKLPGDDRRLDESQIDDVSSHIFKYWKSVGRHLNLTENELNKINLDFQGNSETEKAFQMLIMWRERYPEEFTIGVPHVNMSHI